MGNAKRGAVPRASVLASGFHGSCRGFDRLHEKSASELEESRFSRSRIHPSREAVALFRQIGETHGITVIGALQDDMEPYAIGPDGQYVKLRRSSDTMPYNEPPVVVGHDEHPGRVRMPAKWISDTRPSTEASN